MGVLNVQAIDAFLALAGERIRTPSRLFLLGGSALVLLGNSRATLDLDYLGDDIDKDEFQRTIEIIADEQRIEIEAVPLDRFIPIDPAAEQRHLFYRRFGLLDVFILDPYLIALSKVDRGFESDIEDVVFLIHRGLVALPELETLLDNALLQSTEYDLSPDQARVHLDLIRRRLSA